MRVQLEGPLDACDERGEKFPSMGTTDFDVADAPKRDCRLPTTKNQATRRFIRSRRNYLCVSRRDALLIKINIILVVSSTLTICYLFEYYFLFKFMLLSFRLLAYANIFQRPICQSTIKKKPGISRVLFHLNGHSSRSRYAKFGIIFSSGTSPFVQLEPPWNYSIVEGLGQITVKKKLRFVVLVNSKTSVTSFTRRFYFISSVS